MENTKRPSKVSRIAFLLWLALAPASALLLGGCDGNGGTGVPGVPGTAFVAATFVDPTATLTGSVVIRNGVFVAPFARLTAGGGHISVVDGSDVQDNVLIDADTGHDVAVGPDAIVAHGATVRGPATVGDARGPCFVGFNALVEGAIIEGGAMVLAVGRVGPGIILHSGKKVLPGKNVTTQTEADDESLGKVATVTDEDIVFMLDVLKVNQSFARTYAALRARSIDQVRGISLDPADPGFNLPSVLPLIGGVPTSDPTYRNRIIGQVNFADALATLSSLMGNQDSVRSDEGAPFIFGTHNTFADEVTFHALEGSRIDVGTGCTFGLHSLVHGGEDSGRHPAEVTSLGDNVQVGDGAIVFRSVVGSNCVIGNRSLVDRCTLPPGTTVPALTILIDNAVFGTVEW
jgi:carbonic anhydrase/acetyltransferase-like protein (isoleucine patch superfamily)